MEKIKKMKIERENKLQEERKTANKNRQPRPSNQRAEKRQKLEDGEYHGKRRGGEKEKTIPREKQPEIKKRRAGNRENKEGENEPKERKEKQDEEENAHVSPSKKRRRSLTEMEKWLQEKIGTTRWTEFPNYEERAREINRSIQKEERDRTSRIERARREEKTWELMRICLDFLDEHCETWRESEKMRTELAEKEEKRKERKRMAEEQKMTFKCGFVQKRINSFMKKLPDHERKQYESEEEKKKRVKLREIKEIMWKKSRQDGETQNLDQESTTEIGNLEDQLSDIEKIVKRIENERAERIQRKLDLESREKEKRDKKTERLELQKKLENKWAMIRWLTEYIDENQDQWNLDREQRQEEYTGELNISISITPGDQEAPVLTEKEKWDEWRKEARRKSKSKQIKPSLAQLSPQEQLNLDKTEEDKTETASEKNKEEEKLDEKAEKLERMNNISELRSTIDLGMSLENIDKVRITPSAWSVGRIMRKFEKKLESSVMRMSVLGCVDEESENVNGELDSDNMSEAYERLSQIQNERVNHDDQNLTPQ